MKRRKRALALALITLVAILLLAVAAREAVLPVARFHYTFESLGKNERNFSVYRHRQTGIVMVEIPGQHDSDTPLRQPYLITRNPIAPEDWGSWFDDASELEIDERRSRFLRRFGFAHADSQHIRHAVRCGAIARNEAHVHAKFHVIHPSSPW